MSNIDNNRFAHTTFTVLSASIKVTGRVSQEPRIGGGGGH